MRRLLWALVAFQAAWRLYPAPTTVLPNVVIAGLLRDAGDVRSANLVRSS